MTAAVGAPGADFGRSGRRSTPVESDGRLPTEVAGPERISAPESLTLSSGSALSLAAPPRAPERRAQPNRAPELQRTTPARLSRIQRELSQRDLAVLASIDDHRFLTTGQIQALHFLDHATSGASSRICRRVLARLFAGRLIEHLDRRVGGIRAGSASYVWRIGLVGDQVLRRARGDGVRARRKEPSARHLDHCLAIADAHLALVTAARARRLELLRVDTEPACWRDYLGSSGQRDILKPDLYAVTASDDFEDHWFIEIDRATESLPTLLKKCAQYEHYRRTGREQHDGGVFPAVVWVVPDEPRETKLRAALAASRSIDRSLYRVCTPDAFAELICGGAA